MKSQKTTYQWETGDKAGLVEAAIEKREKAIFGKNHTPIATVGALRVIDQNVTLWRIEFEKHPPRTSKEKSKIIERVNRSAKDLLRDINALGLPVSSLEYFTNEELLERYTETFRLFGGELNWEAKVPDELREHGIDFTIKDFVSFNMRYHPEADVRLDILLKKLTNKDVLHELALDPLRTKKFYDQDEVTYIIRKLAKHFVGRYGDTIPTTILNICAPIYPDAELDYDKVQNKLRYTSFT